MGTKCAITITPHYCAEYTVGAQVHTTILFPPNPRCVVQVPLLVPHLAAVLAACLYTLALQRPGASKARHS